jgi:D-alanyl-D-alanine dipeptidase
VGDIVLMGDPAVAAVPVDECGEPLVRAGDACILSDLKQEDEPFRSHVRQGLHERLVVAAAALPEGIRLCWVEGQRDAAKQQAYFAGYRDHLRALDPSLSDDASHLLASRYIAPPGVAPHVSGAAIDLTLCDADGVELELGTRVNATPEESAGACYFDAPVSREARTHRTVLAQALGGAGLVNYPTEWWHWSYGDRYWALMTGAPAAIYGPIPASSTAG